MPAARNHAKRGSSSYRPTRIGIRVRVAARRSTAPSAKTAIAGTARVFIRNRKVSVPKEGDQEEENPDGRDVPYEGTCQRDARCIEWQIGDAGPKVELGAPFGECIVQNRDMGCEDNRGKQRECFQEIVQCAIETPSHAMQWFSRFVPRARGPAIATLKARGMRSRDDVNEAEPSAEDQECKFARHESASVLTV